MASPSSQSRQARTVRSDRPVPDYLRRDLDGRSVHTRLSSARYATHIQVSREELRQDRRGRRVAAGRAGGY
jgi:hypothetical protein